MLSLLSGVLAFSAVTASPAAAAVGIVDDGGANDAVGQNDLTRLSFDDTNPSFLEINWSWDQPSAITGGGQAVNACAMFDTDADGNVNYSLCLEVSEDTDPGSPTFGQLVISTPDPPDGDTWFPHWIECGDGKSDRCTMPDRLGDPVDLPGGLGATTCSVAVTATDPFDASAANGPGSDYPDDIEASCLLDTSLLPPAGTYEFVNVCSYPSAGNDGNNNPFDCVVTPGSGFLTIIKVADPDDSTVFDFSLSPASSSGDSTFSITGSGIIERIPVIKSSGQGGVGNYTLLEAVPDGWQLNAASCTTNATGTGAATATLPASGPVDAGVGGIEILPGQETICTFNNGLGLQPPDITLTKTANPTSVAEPGGPVTFTVEITNNGDAGTVSALNDDIHGDLVTSCVDGSDVALVGQTIGSGETLTCTFTADVNGIPGYSETDTVEGTVTNDAGSSTASDTATVTIVDVGPSPLTIVKEATTATSLPEPGGDFGFSVTITNPSTVDTVTVSDLDDTYVSDLQTNGSCSDAEGNTTAPYELSPGEAMTCTFTVAHSEVGTYTNVVSVTAVDDDGASVGGDSNPVTVEVTDVAPTVTLDKSVTPLSLDEPGGVFTYTLAITNTSDEAVEIVSLTDDYTLSQQCLDLVGTSIAAGNTASCSYAVTHTDPGAYTNTASVTVEDNDGSQASDDDDATATVNDVTPTVVLTKSVDVATLAEPGGTFTYTLFIENTSNEDVTITDLSDDHTLSADCLALIGTGLAANSSTSCTYEVVYTDAGVYPNSASVTVADDDGNTAGDTDNESVEVTDVTPAVSLDKSVDISELDEPGGTFTYTLTVTNDSVETVTIDSLTDSHTLSAECLALVDTQMAPDQTVSCTYTVDYTDAGQYPNTATVSVSDDDDNTASDNDTETVQVNNVVPTIVLTKSVSPETVDEPGGTFTYTLLIENPSIEDVTVTSLTDDYPLSAECQALVDDAVVVPAGGFVSCDYSVDLSDPGVYDNTATVVVEDNEQTEATDSDDASVTINDVPSSILVNKEANPTTIPETGGDVTYTITVENTSTVDTVTINAVNDDRFFDITDECLPDGPVDLAPGEIHTCTITRTLGQGDTGNTHTNLATVSGVDDDGDPVSGNDNATVTYTDVPGSIEIIKTADPISVDEPGGDVTFTFVVNNTSAVDTVTINSLEDSIYGDITAVAGSTCSVPQVIAVDGSYSCSFTAFVGGNANDSETNVVTATGVDDDGVEVTDDDEATVTINDVPSSILTTKTASPGSVPETGGDVTYTVTVKNTSAVDTVTINSVVDDMFGDVSASCAPALPADLLPGETVTCSFSEFISGDSPDVHTNVVTASGQDDDGNPVEDDDQEDVPFEDVLPDVSVTKTANPSSVPETGGNVDFTFVVTNNSTEAATLDSLVDDTFGDLDGQGTCATGGTIAPGDSYVCSITVFMSGEPDLPHTNVVTAMVSDNDDNTDEDTDDETVLFDDVLPDVSIAKTANPSSVPETGGDVEFTIEVTNNSLEDATIDSLVDSDFDLAANCADAVGTVLANGASYTCIFTEFVSGDFSGPAHENTATVVASDNDGNSDTESDDELVGFIDVLPTITVSKTANPTSVPETGAPVEFTIVVSNTSQENVTITSLGDSDFDLSPECDGAVGTDLAPGATYTCSVTETISGDVSGPPHENTATAVAEDNEGNDVSASDDAEVAFIDVLPDISVAKTANPTSVPETGGDVVFTFVVTNNAAEDATLTSLVDSDFLDLDGQGTCSVPQPLAANGGTYSCEITQFISGDFGGPDHNNVVTATASDNDGNPAEDSDDATVDFTDVLPDLSITKTANPTSVDEPGGNVTFTLVITNNSLEEVGIDSLTDSDYDTDLAVSCPDATDINLQYKQEYVCVFSAFVSGNSADGPHENTATVVGSDDDDNSDTASDDEAVTINDVAPSMTVTKKPNQDEVFAPGEDVVFTIRVENTSVASDPITITELDDDVFGDISSDCVLPQIVGAGGAFECDITWTVTADHTNTVTATANDDEGNVLTETASASVLYADPSLTIEKSTGPADADSPPGPEILVGETVNWFYQVTNDGNVDLTDLTVIDDQGVAVTCPTTVLPAGATTVCEGSGTAIEGQYANVGTASASYTDADGQTATPSASDPSHYVGTAPSLSITKTFADDSVTAGGAGSSFELVVTNTGNVDLENVSVFDVVDDRLTVTGVSGTAGADNDSDADAQTVEWLIASLAEGDSVTITVNFAVASSVEEADGPGGVNDDPAVSNTATASSVYTDDVGNSTTVDDDGSDTIDVTTSADLRVEKTDAFDPILAGNQVTYTVTVYNDGPSDADNVVAADSLPAGVTLASTSGCQEDPAGVPTCSLGTIAAGGSASYDIVVDVDAATAGSITNSVTVTSDDPDPDPDNNDAEEDTFIASPSVSITKTFADDSVVAGGAASSFNLVVENDGNVDLSGVSISDVVDPRLQVTGVSGTAGVEDDSDTDPQTVEWLIADLGAGETVTITVNFSVAADVEEADGVGGLNDEDGVSNTATVTNTYTDDAGNSIDLSDEASDTVDIKVDIDLSIVKTFSPDEVPQGTIQSFTLVVSNAGPSDAIGVSVTDLVDDSIAVTGVSPTGDCSASSGQNIDCTLDIPAGTSATITVDYIAAPFLDETSPYGTLGGDDFRFVFVNGSVLEGSTAGGPVYLDGVDITANVTILSSLTRNDLIFDPPGPDPAFELHLSCSDPFTGGWGQSGGPVEGVDTNWQIAYFSIARFNNNGYIKNCGNVTNPFDVDNTATATGEDSFGTESATDTATLTIGPGITLDRLQTNGKRLTVRLTNFTGDDKEIVDIDVKWPSSNGNLIKIRLDEPTVWQGGVAPPQALLDANDGGWNGGTLLTGEGILRFDFKNKSASTGYTIRVNFTDGTFLDISQ